MSTIPFDKEFRFLMNASAEKRVKSQQNAVELLFENYRDALQSSAVLKQDAVYQRIGIQLFNPGQQLFRRGVTPQFHAQ